LAGFDKRSRATKNLNTLVPRSGNTPLAGSQEELNKIILERKKKLKKT